MFVEIKSADRSEVERQMIGALWHGKDIRLTAGHREGEYFVSLHTLDGEPEPTTPMTT